MPRLPLSQLLSYAMFGFPLAMVALPIYVYVPQFYADRLGMSLSAIGTALLLTRIMDAFIDPFIGAVIDRRPQSRTYAPYITLALPLLIAGFIALFHPPHLSGNPAFLWFFVTLVVVYAGFSLASIAYQSWGAALTQEPGQRVRLTSVREACGLVGVIATAVIIQFGNVTILSGMLSISLLITAWLLIRNTPRKSGVAGVAHVPLSLRHLFANRSFRALFLVFVVNGIAAAIPATLFLFFTKDRLHLEHLFGILLLMYFLAAALSMPLWTRLAHRKGEVKAWLLAMLLSVLSFVGVLALGVGDAWVFSLICIFSGMSLGADLALPPALLAGVIHAAGHSDKNEASYFGVWNWASKMNLALAAGLALPALEYLGYVPGVASESGLQALTLAYAALPCLLKLLAAALLWKASLEKI
ncbi:MFS transporter [Undibacterium sp. TC4M20W]|uniref:MFS transporter n=1 Tax=Undibacterium sp. TC4M20W TaxID=3413052 RepID=UPI003BF3DF13